MSEQPLPLVLYISGAGRSGSTLLERLLHERLRATASGELSRFWTTGVERDAMCSCGEHFSGCEFWPSVTRQLRPTTLSEVTRCAAQRAHSHKHAARLRLGRPLDPDLGSALRDLYSAIATTANTSAVIDSSKSPAWMTSLVAAGLPVHQLHLRRDSRAVVYSWTRKKLNPALGEAALMKRYTLKQACNHWNTKNLWSLLLKTRSRTTVSYEALTANVDECLGAIARSSAVERVAGRESPPLHQIWGNPMRLQKGPLTVRVDRRWQSELTESEQHQILRRTAPVRLLTGYSLLGRRERETS